MNPDKAGTTPVSQKSFRAPWAVILGRTIKPVESIVGYIMMAICKAEIFPLSNIDTHHPTDYDAGNAYVASTKEL